MINKENKLTLRVIHWYKFQMRNSFNGFNDDGVFLYFLKPTSLNILFEPNKG